MKRFITQITLAGAVAALLVPVAGARLDSGNPNSSGPSAASFYTPQALKADGLRWEALADSQSAASFYTPQALKADGLRWKAIAESYGVSTGTGKTTGSSYLTAKGLHQLAVQLDAARHQLGTSGSVSDTGGGFPVQNVGIGVGGGLFALLLAAGLVAVTRRSRHQQPAHA